MEDVRLMTNCMHFTSIHQLTVYIYIYVLYMYVYTAHKHTNTHIHTSIS